MPDALQSGRQQLAAITARLAKKCVRDGRIRHGDIGDIGPEAFALAHHHARFAASSALIDWADGHDDHARALAKTHVATTLNALNAWCEAEPTARPFVREALSTERLDRIGAALLARDEPEGPTGLTGVHADLAHSLAHFARDRIAPLAEAIHRQDLLIPEDLLTELAELGVFGVSIPERYGGCFIDHRAVVVATEALSTASLGAGGSVITRPEICTKALLAGGSEDQKARFLPEISDGRRIVCVAVTEPDAGSDVAALRTVARPVQGGWRITGEKMWCTLGGRADTLVLLARTGGPGHRGLSLFLVDKPTSRERVFSHQQDGGGEMSGSAIATVGYRGMHSYAIALDDWFVPDTQRIGDEGQGFFLMMKGFEGGRIQTAARAVGVMRASLNAAVFAGAERRIFGRTLGDLPLTRARLAVMAATVQAGRQLAYRVADQMDDDTAGIGPALVKLMTCRDAEHITRDAMQLHGGLGYAEESDVSRYWLDARVLSIFEGAEEVLALRVIAPTLLREHL